MCRSCYNEYGAPRIDTVEVRQLADAITAVYATSSVGGNLHVVVDDWNLEDESIAWCVSDLALTAVEQSCAALLLLATLQERASALALYDGFWVSAEIGIL